MDTYFLWKLNRKSYTLYNMVTLALSDLNHPYFLLWVFLYISGMSETRLQIVCTGRPYQVLSLGWNYFMHTCTQIYTAPEIVRMNLRRWMGVVVVTSPNFSFCRPVSYFFGMGGASNFAFRLIFTNANTRIIIYTQRDVLGSRDLWLIIYSISDAVQDRQTYYQCQYQ